MRLMEAWTEYVNSASDRNKHDTYIAEEERIFSKMPRIKTLLEFFFFTRGSFSILLQWHKMKQ